jgi:hypothetical protein
MILGSVISQLIDPADDELDASLDDFLSDVANIVHSDERQDSILANKKPYAGPWGPNDPSAFVFCLGETVGDLDVFSSVAAAERKVEHWQLRNKLMFVDGDGLVLEAYVGPKRAVVISPTGRAAERAPLVQRLRSELTHLQTYADPTTVRNELAYFHADASPTGEVQELMLRIVAIQGFTD